MRQVDGPNAVERYSGKKLVSSQWQPFELSGRDLGHCASFGEVFGTFNCIDGGYDESDSVAANLRVIIVSRIRCANESCLPPRRC